MSHFVSDVGLVLGCSAVYLALQYLAPVFLVMGCNLSFQCNLLHQLHPLSFRDGDRDPLKHQSIEFPGDKDGIGCEVENGTLCEHQLNAVLARLHTFILSIRLPL